LAAFGNRGGRRRGAQLEMNCGDESAGSVHGDERFPRLKWNQAALWMGADFFGLIRILRNNGWRIRPSLLPDCLIDLTFALANTCLKGLQLPIYRSRLERVEFKEDPLLIIGHWRTGTTLLHELLALDPRHTFPTTYQCFSPNHFLLTERWLKSWSGFVLPPNRPPDNMDMGWDLPQEDEFALCNLGVPSPYATIAFPNHPPQNEEYAELEAIPPQHKQRWMNALRQFLKQIHYGRPGRIILKSPSHTFRLPVLLEMFPHARFVHMVRDPVTVFMSTVRLWKSLYAAHGYQEPDYEGLEEYVLTTFTRMHERLEATRALVPPGRLLDVRYEDLVGDTVGTMRAIYDQLDLGDYERVQPDIEAYVAAHADYRTNRYEPTARTKLEICRRWKPYFDRYGYEVDPAAT
jgi:hypothetical protein